MTYFTPRTNGTRGFSLMELAIVLGIIGIIIGGIWVAGAALDENNRTKHVTEEVMFTVEGFRSLYAGRRIDVAEGTDLTNFAITNQLVPQDMIKTSTTVLYPPYSNTQLNLVARAAINGVQFNFTAMPRNACVHLATSLGSQMDGLAAVTINGMTRNFAIWGTGADAQFTAVDIDARCTAGVTNTIGITYALSNEKKG